LLFNWYSFPHINLFIICCFQASSFCQFQIAKLIEIRRAVWRNIGALIWNIYSVRIIIIFIAIIFNKIWNIVFILKFIFITILIFNFLNNFPIIIWWW
jgi:hypothetical protein